MIVPVGDLFGEVTVKGDKKSPMRNALIIGAIMGLATLGLLVYSALTSFGVLCEVCVTFEGRTACREAYGNTRDEAVSTAQSNACALIASGMTEIIACGRAPARVTCE